MTLTRNLRYGMSGEDVMYVKQRLLELGCYAPEITGLTRNVFGRDTLSAVIAFQSEKGLERDGIVGPITFAALFAEADAAEDTVQTDVGTADSSLLAHLPAAAASALLSDLAGVSDVRKNLVLDALSFAVSPDLPGDFPRSLYIRGGNLYNTDLTPNVITLSRIASGAKRQPEYYDGGRREMMESAVLANPNITGADCSGGVVGLLRHAGVVSSGFDCSADGFNKSSKTADIAKSALISGDFLHKSGHIGLYAGGGYAVEWMGGAYGCQLTSMNKRRGWNYVEKRLATFSSWTDFLRPKYYN